MVRETDGVAADASRCACERRGSEKEGGPRLTHLGGTALCQRRDDLPAVCGVELLINAAWSDPNYAKSES